ncbi:MAG: NAD+ synthase [Candidatus Aureabacteria bacterium]|nr:NAD+ synthase [Candidatus Auribacterota bacterium]
MKIAIAQLNPVVGNITGNLSKLEKTIRQLRRRKPDLIIFPELFITGYPPRDLLTSRWFVDMAFEANKKVLKISKKYKGTGILAGSILPSKEATGKKLHNSALLCYNGRLVAAVHKTLLPAYDVFDETRYFQPSDGIRPVRFKGKNLGITICEDAWNFGNSSVYGEKYASNPVEILADKKADLIINLSASPYQVSKDKVRFELFGGQAKKFNVPFLFVNQVGGNDELIFDGGSMFLDNKGRVNTILPAFKETACLIDTSEEQEPAEFKPLSKTESIYNALCLGLKDYVEKCGFKKVVLGLSGGIDSAVVCCIAARALGKENVTGIMMPSKFSSRSSIEDSKKLIKNLGIESKIIPIRKIVSSFESSFKAHFKKTGPGIAEENIQARVRGNILMALSNKFGWLVLSTGNKSELAVGYCTLYGDMSGGLSVLSDVPKTVVYQLARHINSSGDVIPRNIFTKAPSAELKPGQADQDTLPPYGILDRIIELYIDKKIPVSGIVKKGIAAKTVRWVVNTINKNEYKRKQAAPGLKVTSTAFGMGRRMPVAAKYLL